MTKKKHAPYVTKGGLDVKKLDRLQNPIINNRWYR